MEALGGMPPSGFRDALAKRSPQWGRWSFDRDDIAKVGSQAQNGTMMPIGDLLPVWKEWMAQDDDVARRDATSHAYFLSLLEKGEDFVSPPALYFHPKCDMQVADGRRRLLAAFEFLSACMSDRSIDVYWERAHPLD